MIRVLTLLLVISAAPASALGWEECTLRLGPGLEPTEGQAVEFVTLAVDITRSKKGDAEGKEEVSSALNEFRNSYQKLVGAVADYCEGLRR